MDVTWSRVTSFPLYILPLDEDAVLYHAGSGNTHRLDELSMAILGSLSAEPRDLEDIVARIGIQAGGADDPELIEAVEARLSELAKYAVVEHHPRQ